MPTVLVYVVAILLALLVVPLTHGRFDRLARVRFARPWLLFLGLALQIGLDLLDLPPARFEDLGIAILLLSYVALLAFCVSNVTMRGMELITLGVALNAVVIALNLGMPYRVADGLPRETTAKHRPTRPTDTAVFLSDQITVGSPVNAAASVGDIVLSLGIIELAYAGSRRRRQVIRSRRRSAPPFETTTDEHRVLDLTDTGEIDLRVADSGADQTAGAPAPATTRSSASNTRGS